MPVCYVKSFIHSTRLGYTRLAVRGLAYYFGRWVGSYIEKKKLLLTCESLGENAHDYGVWRWCGFVWMGWVWGLMLMLMGLLGWQLLDAG